MEKEKSLLMRLYHDFIGKNIQNEQPPNMEDKLEPESNSSPEPISQTIDLDNLEIPDINLKDLQAAGVDINNLDLASLDIDGLEAMTNIVANPIDKSLEQQLEKTIVFDNPLDEMFYNMGLDPNFDNINNPETAIFTTKLKILAKEYNKKFKTTDKPVDASVNLHVSRNSCEGYIFVFPPLHGGADITLKAIKDMLVKREIKEGIVSELLNLIVSDKIYGKLMQLAQTPLPIAGANGSIEHLIKVNKEPKFTEDPKGNIDFKDLGIINNIIEDTVICNIHPPTLGEDGMSVKGVVIKAKAGIAAPNIRGNNTHLSEDGNQLIASINGELLYEDQKYSVSPVLNIDGNVDMSVGNIDFVGDINIKGNVMTGFNVIASGSISVNGIVENATLNAKGDVVVAKGINGGHIICQGDLRSNFIENTSAEAGGDIITSSIINSKVYSNKTITVTTGKGVIVGGQVSAYKIIKANAIGTENSRENKVMVGFSKETMEEITFLRKQMISDLALFKKVDANVNFLRGDNQKTPERAKLFITLLQQSKLLQQRIEQSKLRLDDLESIRRDLSGCNITAGTIYPITTVNIGDFRRRVSNLTTSANFYINEEGDMEEASVKH